jgi:hypothetical protein
MTLEYQEDIDKINKEDNFSDCPPADYTSKNYDAFRFVFENIEHESNFKPLYHLNPPRIENAEAVIKCKSLAISLYTTLKSAKSMFEILTARRPEKMYKTIGTHLAFSELKEEDGICDIPNKDGHISHHFAKDFDYKNRFKIISKLQQS